MSRPFIPLTMRILHACSDDALEDGFVIDTELVPVAGPGTPVKPAIYEGGKYQVDKRWPFEGAGMETASSPPSEPADVIILDNVPSQANRLEATMREHRESMGLPEMVLDLSGLENLPSHLPSQISSFEFPHRNADAYLRDAVQDDEAFIKTELGRAIFDATADNCGALMSWFPQALLFGFWQSHLGKKRTASKHARAWVSEIVGWEPAGSGVRRMGLKGDPLNLNIDEKVIANPDDMIDWSGAGAGKKGSKKLSEIGHGQVPFMGEQEGALAGVSFRRITQRASLSFAQLRRVSFVADNSSTVNAAARALLVAMGLHAHFMTYERGFALRSGAELRPSRRTLTWLSSEDGDFVVDEMDRKDATLVLLQGAYRLASDVGVPLEGWHQPPISLTPNDGLVNAIRSTWPALP